MVLLKRNAVVGGGRGRLRLLASHTTQQRVRQAPPALVPVTSIAPFVECPRRNDFCSFLTAELTDTLFLNQGATNVLEIDRRSVMEAHGRCVLHPNNDAVWQALIASLHARGALCSADRIGAQRFLAASTYQDLFPWLWADGDVRGSQTNSGAQCGQHAAAARSPTPAASKGGTHGDGVESATPPSLKAALDELRSVSPDRWVCLVTAAFSRPSASADDSLGRIQLWQEVFFALSVNPFFAMSADHLHCAHASLLQIVDLYYTAAIAAQRSAPPPRVTASLSPPSSNASQPHPTSSFSSPASACFTFTRMPPMLLRKWKKLYRAQFALLDYAELHRRVVLGEEAVVAEAEAQVKHASSNDGDGHTYPLHLSTALLDDDDLFLFYLTIPGRRECGLSWEDQWERTLQHAQFAFARLFRTKLLRLPETATMATSGRESITGLEVIRKAAGMLMNVCMWVRNNNGEGARYLQATRLVLETYFEATGASANGQCARDVDAAAQTWALVTVLRETALAAMLAKAERLHYACSPGLFEVATAAVALEVLKPDDDAVITPRDVQILLHPSKTSSAAVVWDAASSHPSGPSASCYGLITVGLRLARSLVQASASHLVPRAALHRLGNELRAWCAPVGRPLHLTSIEMQSLWHGQIVGKSPTANEAAWAAVLAPAAGRGGCGDPPGASWTCGCGFTSDFSDVESRRHPTARSCPVCVLRSSIPHSWQCPTCLYTANTGEPSAFCLHCGAAHPSLQRPTASPPLPALDEQILLSDKRDNSLFVCDNCHMCSVVAAERSAADGAAPPVGCAACGSSRGYVRGFFTWRCGCGAVNSPTHTHCTACTRRCAADAEETHVEANVETHVETHVETRVETSVETKVETLRVRAPEGFAPVYQCVSCQRDVRVARTAGGAVGSVAARDKNLNFSAECPHCRHPHPLPLAAVVQRRLVHCPGCDAVLPAESERCRQCGNTALPMLRPLLMSFADQPWLCHGCGHHNPIDHHRLHRQHHQRHHHQHHQGLDTAVCLSEKDETCEVCGVHRVPAVLWEMGRRWNCHRCGAADNFGILCGRCESLTAAVPAAEVHVWRCPICTSTRNGSWAETCSLPGCGGRQRDAVAGQKIEENAEKMKREEVEDVKQRKRKEVKEVKEVKKEEEELKEEETAVRCQVPYAPSTCDGRCGEAERLTAVERLLTAAALPSSQPPQQFPTRAGMSFSAGDFAPPFSSFSSFSSPSSLSSSSSPPSSPPSSPSSSPLFPLSSPPSLDPHRHRCEAVKSLPSGGGWEDAYARALYSF